VSKAKPHKKTRDQIPKIKRVMVFLARNTVAKACERFPSQIKAVVAAGGIFIK
jgi:hypothetical protein